MDTSAAMPQKPVPRRACSRCIVGDAVGAGAEADRHPDYLLIEEIARTDTGVVWKAFQTSLARPVAFTRMTAVPGMDEASARGAFLDEAATAGMLQHPSIVPVYDVGIDQHAVPFFAGPPDLGEPWSAVIADRNDEENLEIFLRTCDATGFAHDHGVIHGDITPANVLLGPHGSVMVAGWGRALRLDRLDAYRHGAVHGASSHLAPEQALGDPRRMSTRTDIYLLGGVLHQLATGELPHPGGHAATATAVARANRSGRPHACSELAAIARRCLSSDPQERFATVADLQLAVQVYRQRRISRTLADAGSKALGTARLSRSDDDFLAAIAHFQEARHHWNANGAANDGLVEARFALAELAAARGDLDLAHRHITRTEHPATPGLAQRIEHLRALRRSREGRILLVKRVVWGAVGLGIGGLALALFLSLARQQDYAAASEERIQARMRLTREELDMAPGAGRWRPVFAEDFQGGVLGKALAIVTGDWQVKGGRLGLHGADPGRLALMAPAGAARVEIDVIGPGSLQIHWPLAAPDGQEATVQVTDDALVLTVPGRAPITALRRSAMAGVAAHVVVECLDGACRVHLNGEPRLEAPIVKGPTGAQRTPTRLTFVAGADTVLDNLVIDAFEQ